LQPICSDAGQRGGHSMKSLEKRGFQSAVRDMDSATNRVLRGMASQEMTGAREALRQLNQSMIGPGNFLRDMASPRK
jgi:hypothetical protein